MLLYFFLFSTNILFITSSDLKENKYIDGLKEPEKREFIESIVRRIAEEISIKDVPTDGSKNISDAELNKHSDYVKKIINEERITFEKQNMKANENLTKKKDLSSKKRKSWNGSNIDLTLRQNSRKKRNDYVTIPVKTVYDVDANTEFEKPVGNDDIQVKGSRPKARRSTNLDLNADTPVPSDKENNEVKSPAVTEVSKDINPTVNVRILESTSTVTENVVTATVADKIILRSDDAHTETTTLDDGELSDQNKVSKDLKPNDKDINEDNSKVGPLVTSNVKVSKNVSTIDDTDTSLDSNTYVNRKFNNLTEQQVVSLANTTETRGLNSKVTPLKVEIDETNTKNDTEVKVLQTTNKILDNTNNTNKDISKQFSTNKTENKLTVESDKNNVSMNATAITKDEVQNSKQSSELNEEIKTLQIADDLVKALRMGIDRDTKYKKDKMKKKSSHSNTNNLNVYGFYDSSDEDARENQENNKEQPYYVPVYNFYAKNAYYNAYNKFGPNQEDLQSQGPKNDKGPYKYFSIYSSEESDLSVQKFHRSFYKRPKTKHSKSYKGNIVPFQHNIPYPVLPMIAENAYNLPLYDYDYINGNDFLRDSVLRANVEQPGSEDSLKGRLKNIRESIYTYKEGNKKVNKDEGRAWLDVEEKNKKEMSSKSKPRKLSSHPSQAVDYDYIDEVHDRDFSKKRLINIALKSNFDSKISNALDSPKNVNIRAKEEKNKFSMSEKLPEVYSLLKKLMKIINYEEDKEVEATVRVMGDLIQTNNEGLEQYDWLESTVNIQSAIEKLSELTTAVTLGLRIHPSDFELLKYTTYLFSLASSYKPSDTRARLPKSKKYGNRSKSFGDRVWLYRIPDPDQDYVFDYNSFQKFLNNLADSLYDLHDAIKYISMVTTLNSQHWFKDLKDLYLHTPTRKQLLELVLHLGTTRLFNLIEDSSKKGIEDDFLKFIHDNQLEVSRVRDAFVFVLRVLDVSLDNKLIENY